MVPSLNDYLKPEANVTQKRYVFKQTKDKDESVIKINMIVRSMC